jgi:hypothetical protein
MAQVTAEFPAALFLAGKIHRMQGERPRGLHLDAQASDVEPVHPALIRPKIRPQAQSALGCDPRRINAGQVQRRAVHAQTGMPRQSLVHLNLALIR